MSTTPDGFATRLMRLKADLVDQGNRVQALIEAAFDAAFAQDVGAATRVVGLDEAIDTVDVAIEKAAVILLTDATGMGAALHPDQLRMVLTIVKVNNELERIADAGVGIAERVAPLAAIGAGTALPETFRVMANSLVGILRDANDSLERGDPELAKVVLASEDAVEAFKRALLRETGERLSAHTISVDLAFLLQEVATFCEIMAGHCTNIAEQVIYLGTGAIVRHMQGHWEEFRLPTG